MTEYSNIKIEPELFDEMASDKPDGVTWTYYLRQLFETSPYVETNEE